MAKRSSVATGDVAGEASRPRDVPAFRISEPGVYDLPEAVYHADPCPEPSLSASLAGTLVEKSARHAWHKSRRLNPKFEDDSNGAMDFGKAAHALMIEGDARVVIVEHDDWRTNDAKAQRDAAKKAGRIPLLEKDWGKLSRMIRAGREQLAEHRDAFDAFRDGVGERSIFWRDMSPSRPIWCRIRADWLNVPKLKIFDYKTTENAAPAAWGSRQLWNLGFDIQSSFYGLGCERAYNEPFSFFFIVQEVDEPFALSVVSLDPEAAEIADYRRDLAMEAWAQCMARQQWPGYSARTSFLPPPAWLSKRMEAFKVQAAFDREDGIDPFELSVKLWQP